MFGCLNIFSRAFGGMFLGGWSDVLLINGHLKGSVRDFGLLISALCKGENRVKDRSLLYIYIFECSGSFK